jgi:hypothetical protein
MVLVCWSPPCCHTNASCMQRKRSSLWPAGMQCLRSAMGWRVKVPVRTWSIARRKEAEWTSSREKSCADECTPRERGWRDAPWLLTYSGQWSKHSASFGHLFSRACCGRLWSSLFSFSAPEWKIIRRSCINLVLLRKSLIAFAWGVMYVLRSYLVDPYRSTKQALILFNCKYFATKIPNIYIMNGH